MAEYYSNEPDQKPIKDMGTAPMILGICSIVLSLTFSRLIGLILGIIAVVQGAKAKEFNSDAKAGFIMGIIGICMNCVLLFLLLLLITFLFVPVFCLY